MHISIGLTARSEDTPARKGANRIRNHHLITQEKTPDATATAQATDESSRLETGADPRGALPAGTQAPYFELPATPDQRVNLNELRGRPVILVFYPADWSPVCSDQMALYNELLPEFNRFHAVLLGVSVDGPWCHLAFANDRKYHFQLLSDFEPKGGVAKDYQVYNTRQGTSERALFVLDSDGVIFWSYVSPMGINPGADGILAALESLSRKGQP